MAEYWIDPQDGLDTNDGLSPAAPKKTMPYVAGNTIVETSGNIYNVRNGTTSRNRFLINDGHDNLTFRGYGMAANVLVLNLPIVGTLATYEKRVAREAGVHEGQWIIDVRTETAAGSIIQSSAIDNLVVQDCHIIGPSLTGLASGMNQAGQTINADRSTIQRCWFELLRGKCHTGYCKNVTIEDCRFEKTGDDLITNAASLTNGYQAGCTMTVRNCELRHPNWDFNLGKEGAGTGDFLQLIGMNDSWNGTLIFENNYGWKEGYNKQSCFVVGGQGTYIFRNFTFDGGGSLSMGAGALYAPAKFIVENFCLGRLGGSAGNTPGYTTTPFVRFNSNSSGTILPDGWGTGVSIVIRNGVWATDTFSGIVAIGTRLIDVGTFDCSILVENITVPSAHNTTDGLDLAGVPIAATFCLYNIKTIISPNFTFTCRNCTINAVGAPVARMEDAGMNTDKYIFQNNNFAPTAQTFQTATGSTQNTTFADVAAFQAGNNRAVNNMAVAADLDMRYAAKMGNPALGVAASPLVGAGRFVGYQTDLKGAARRNPPSIGAFEPLRIRGVRA